MCAIPGLFLTPIVLSYCPTAITVHCELFVTGSVVLVPARASLREGSADRLNPEQWRLQQEKLIKTWEMEGKKMKSQRVKKRVHLWQTLACHRSPLYPGDETPTTMHHTCRVIKHNVMGVVSMYVILALVSIS